MNILISQSQGETFAALSLQRPLLNTLAHTRQSDPPPSSSCTLPLPLLSFFFFSIPVVAHLCECYQAHTEEDNMRAFTQGERGIGWAQIIRILTSLSVPANVNCLRAVCLCVRVKLSSQRFSLLTFPKGTPTQRSRSLSPASSLDLSSGGGRETDQRIRDLDELLQLKVTS